MAKQAIADAKRLNAFGVDPDHLCVVGIDTKDKEGQHPLWDERIHLKVNEALVLNIMAMGVLEPVLVRKNGELLEVIDGRQRVLAARVANGRMRAAGLEPILVPCMVRRDDAKTALGVMISTNEQRIDDMPLTRARKAQRLLNLGQDEDYVAQCFGLSVQQVKNLLSLLDLDERVQKAVERGELGATVATQLADLKHSDQWTKAQELVTAGAGVAEAKRQKQERTAAKKNGGQRATSNDEARGKRPSVSVVRKLGDAKGDKTKEFIENLSPDARDLFYWMLGEESRAKRVKGLMSALREIGAVSESDAE